MYNCSFCLVLYCTYFIEGPSDLYERWSNPPPPVFHLVSFVQLKGCWAPRTTSRAARSTRTPSSPSSGTSRRTPSSATRMRPSLRHPRFVCGHHCGIQGLYKCSVSNKHFVSAKKKKFFAMPNFLSFL